LFCFHSASLVDPMVDTKYLKDLVGVQIILLN